VVFVHSWGVNSEMWGYQIADLLEHGARCVTYDRRGHGRSSDPGRGYDPDTLADDLAAVMDQLDLREATLVGHSMGGGEIVRYLIRHGECAGGRRGAAGLDHAFPDEDARQSAWRGQGHVRGRPGGLAQGLPQMARRQYDPFFVVDTSPAMKAWGVGMLLKTPLPVLIECNRTMAGTDYRPDLRAIKKPVLVLHGDKDASAVLELTGKPSAALIRAPDWWSTRARRTAFSLPTWTG